MNVSLMFIFSGLFRLEIKMSRGIKLKVKKNFFVE